MALPSTYMTSTRNLEGILDAIRTAAVPHRFTYEFLKQLGFTSSTDRPVVPLLKALRLLDDSGVPTQRYARFRDPSESPHVLGEALKDAYVDVFTVNQHAHQLSPSELRGVFARLTGKQAGVVDKMAATFRAIARHAAFDARDGGNGTEHAVQPSGEAFAPPTGIHPLIAGLIQELPPAGAPFPVARQQDWLEIAQVTFRLIYRVEEDERRDEEEATVTGGAVATQSPDEGGAVHHS